MKTISTCLLALFFINTVMSQPIEPSINYQPLATGIQQPVDIAIPNDRTNRLFVVQQNGIVKIWDGTTLRADTFLNIISRVVQGGERGLLSMAFHPQYETNRYFFVYYTKSGDGSLTITRFRTSEGNANQADASSGVEILSIPHPSNTNHNGGKLHFGKDGYLYIGTGDGGGSNDVPNNAQNGQSLLGKMLRVDVNDFADNTPPLYSIPSDNPYVGNENVRDEIIAMGLRNPFRWSFDSETGDMWIGDVGQGAREEVNFRAASDILSPTNYGWRCFEGSIANPSSQYACPAPPNNVPPVFDYQHNAAGGVAVTGGVVYRGSEFPHLRGFYLCADYYTGNIWFLRKNESGSFDVTPQTINRQTAIAAFAEAPDGQVYAVKLNTDNAASSGVLYKLTAESTVPLRLLSFTGKIAGSFHNLSWKMNGSNLGDKFIVERRLATETDFTEVGSPQSARNTLDYYTEIMAVGADTYYRLKIVEANGAVSYSPVVRLTKSGYSKEVFTANLSGSFVAVQLKQPAKSIQIYNEAGAILATQQLNGQTGMIQIPLNTAGKSILFIRVNTDNDSEVKKLFR